MTTGQTLVLKARKRNEAETTSATGSGERFRHPLLITFARSSFYRSGGANARFPVQSNHCSSFHEQVEDLRINFAPSI